MKDSKLVRGIIASVAFIVLSAPAIASADGLKGKAVKVTYADLNLEKEAGAKSLYRRLQQASKQACGVVSLKSAGSVKIMSEMQTCYRTTLTAAVEKVDNSELTKIHES
jgi:UrcA family protein